ncbi:MAG: DUF2344 domain-containing protein [Lachnospiraceae bacterium]|nr:DUF2344 domain-containing protein [Lachnospiraceae bacterium]
MSEETYKIRIKYAKMGVLKYIGHLDLMRFFQKAVKRADFDIAYSQGYSPHQLMSFAAPLALGVTSEGEYFDAQFNSLIPSDEFVRKFNEQMVDGVYVKDVILLPEKAKKAMSIVAASDYVITFKSEDDLDFTDDNKTEKRKVSDIADKKKKILEVVPYLLEKETIEVFRKTKKNEKVEDIKKGIYKLEVRKDNIYMFLATGSEYNLKPESVLEALCNEAGVEYNKFDYHIHRIETYYKNEDNNLVSLLETGERII